MSLRFRIARVAAQIATMNMSCKFRLLDLPNELIALIIEHVDETKALRRLARTCRRIQYLAEPVLYRSLFIRTAGDAEDICDALESRPRRALGVQELEVPLDPQYRQNYRAVAMILRQARNLKKISFESPQCNNGNFEEEEPWSVMTDNFFAPFQAAVELVDEARLASRPLQKLQKLTIHLNGCGSPYWNIDGKGMSLLQHPTLQYLKMSCVNILDTICDHIHDTKKTPLKQLVLEECNVTHRGLYGILSLPKGLEKLFLGENCNNIRHFPDDVDELSSHLFSNDAGTALEALRLQKDTLQELTYVTTETYYQHRQLAKQRMASKSSADAGFADFHQLVKVSLAGQCPDFERALMTSRSPPNLRAIEFKGLSPFKKDLDSAGPQDFNPLSLVPFLRAPSCSVPQTLKTLDVTYESERATFRNPDPEFELSKTAKDLIQAAGKATEQIGIQMKVLYRRYHNYYPPYLYGERIPRDVLVFTGHADGFVGRFAPGADKQPRQIIMDDSETEWEYTSDEDD